MAKQPNFAKSSMSLIGMLLPLLYFGGLIYYFSGVGGGTLQGIIDIGLGPTMFGLSALGLLFAIKPVMLLIRFLAGLSGGATPAPSPRRNSADTDESLGSSDFNADDALARYIAKRNAAPVESDGLSAARAEPNVAAASPRPSFGRKSV